jgi:hypothetical protein
VACHLRTQAEIHNETKEICVKLNTHQTVFAIAQALNSSDEIAMVTQTLGIVRRDRGNLSTKLKPFSTASPHPNAKSRE